MTYSPPSNPALILDDSATTYAPTGGGTFTRKGTVAGVSRIYDAGSSIVPKTFIACLQASVLDRTNGNEQYVVTIEAANAVVLNGSGVPVDFAGEIRTLSEPWNLTVKDQQDVVGVSTLDPLDNTVWRYLRYSIQVSGTTPQVKASAFLRALSDLPYYTYMELVQTQVFTLQNIHNAIGCWFSWAAGSAWGGINNDGKYPIYDGFGHAVYRKCPAQLEADNNPDSPLFYGAIADGLSHKASGYFANLAAMQAKYAHGVSLDQEMDWLGIQAALNAGYCVSRRRSFKVMNAAGDPQLPLTAISGKVEPDFGNSLLDCTAMAPVTTPQWVTGNPTFAAGTGWYNATGYSSDALIQATFNTGEAVLTDIGYTTGTTPNSYFEFKRFESLAAGQYECTATIISTKGGSYDRGNPNPPYLNIRFNASGAPGENVPVGIANASFAGILSNEITQTIRFTINLTAPGSGLMTLRAGGYGSHRVTQFGVKRMIYNCAVLMTRDGATEAYPPAMSFKRAWIKGPGRGVVGSRGLYHQSLINTDGTLMNCEGLKVSGFESGWEGGNGAYLIEFRGCKMIGNKYGYHFPEGNKNAGENLRVIGGENNSNDILLYTPGACEWTFVTTAHDYPDSLTANNGQIWVGKGRVTFDGVHAEYRPTTVVGKPVYDFEGTLTTISGTQLVSSPLGGCVEPPVHFRTSHSSWRVYDTEVYNLTDVNGVMCSGPGQIIGRFLNAAGNPNIGKLLSRAPVMDVLGGAGKFLDTAGFGDIGKKASASGQFTSNGGNGETVTVGSRVYTIVAALTTSPATVPNEVLGGISGSVAAVNMTNAINGGPGAGTTYSTGTAPHDDVTASNSGGKLTVTAKTNGVWGNAIAVAETSAVFSWPTATLTGGVENISLEGGCFPYAGSVATSQWAGNNYALERRSDYTLNGSECLRFTKSAPGNTVGASIRIQARVDQASNLMGLLQLLFPNAVGTGTAALYYQMWWVQCIGYDTFNRPKWGQWRQFKGENNVAVPLAGSTAYYEKIISSLYSVSTSDESQGVATGAPAGATHFAVVIDTQSLPAMAFYILDMILNRA